MIISWSIPSHQFFPDVLINLKVPKSEDFCLEVNIERPKLLEKSLPLVLDVPYKKSWVVI